jgi:hypothetical protein
MNNTHNQSIPQAELDEIKQSVEKALSLLKPYTIPLTPGERSNMAKLGDKTLAFVEKTNSYALANPQLCPAYFDQAAFAIDFADYRSLRPLVVLTEQLLHNIDDTMMVAGSEAFIASLSFYNSAKDAAKRDIPGAKAVYDDLKTRFPQKRGKAAEK